MVCLEDLALCYKHRWVGAGNEAVETDGSAEVLVEVLAPGLPVLRLKCSRLSPKEESWAWRPWLVVEEALVWNGDLNWLEVLEQERCRKTDS